MDDLIKEFLIETNEGLDALERALIKLEKSPNDPELLSEIFRIFHTIKGTCGFLNLPRLENVAHHAENVLGRFHDGTLEATPARVTLIIQSFERVSLIVAGIENTGAEPEGDDGALIEKLDAVYESREEVQHPKNPASVSVSPTGGNIDALESHESKKPPHMQPIGKAWSKLPRLIRDLSARLEKKIELEMRGQDAEIDSRALELIKAPLIHIVRNSGDHGIEDPQTRQDAGKRETGKITLNAYHDGGRLILEIADDGRGLATDEIKATALENGLASAEELAQMSPDQIHQFIFHAGFSTAGKVTTVSGRGVGMDIVRANLEKIGGSIELRSREGQGATFTIKAPITL